MGASNSTDTRLAYRVPEAAAMLGLSRNYVYRAAADGRIPSVKIGKAVLIPSSAIADLLAGAAAGSDTDGGTE